MGLRTVQLLTSCTLVFAHVSYTFGPPERIIRSEGRWNFWKSRRQCVARSSKRKPSLSYNIGCDHSKMFGVDGHGDSSELDDASVYL